MSGSGGAGAFGAGGSGAPGASGAGASGAPDSGAYARLPDPATFSSGVHGTVAGKRGSLRRLGDRALDAWLAAGGARSRIRALAARGPVRDVLVVGIESEPGSLTGSFEELRRSRHRVDARAGDMRQLGGGKFQNLNRLLAERGESDWVLVVDDDVALPSEFLDGFIALAEAFELDLAQPAQTLASHAAWASARRVPFAIARQTNFVEIGPVTAFSRRVTAELLPFPDLRMGWGLDLHWAALARERGWKLGIVDALPVRHETRRVAGAYAPDDAIAEAQRFLADKPYLPAADAGRSLAIHRRVPA